MEKQSKDPYVKITKNSLTSDVWNGNIVRKLLEKLKY